MIQVNGRGLKKGVVSIRPTEDGLVISVDDDERPEFWLTITMSRLDVWRWARLVNVSGYTGIPVRAPVVEHPDRAAGEGGEV